LSSWDEYVDDKSSKDKLCNTQIVLSQFNLPGNYGKFAEEALEVIEEKKEMEKSLELLLRG
jgi:hypothetical protein